MAGETTTPNMNLTLPGVGNTTGPQWSIDLNSSLTTIDVHNHALGSGVQINPSGLNINADLPFGNNNATQILTSRYNPQAGPIAGTAPNLNCVYCVGAELYYNDGAGNQVKITTGGSVNAGAGSITGLPSGTASASYSAGTGTFIWQQATSTAANMDMGSLVIRYPGSYPTPSGNFILLEAPSSLSSGYSLKLPALPVAKSIMALDTSGNISAPYTVDNSTIVISSNIIEVGPLGITAAQIANRTITGNQIAVNAITATEIANQTITATQIANNTITRTQEAAVGQQISSSSGALSFTNPTQSVYNTITNQTVTIIVTGRPVELRVQDDGLGNPGLFSMALGGTSGIISIGFFRDGSVISQNQMRADNSAGGFYTWPASGISYLDTGATAGSHAYTTRVDFNYTGSTTFQISHIVLVAYEL